MKKEPKAPKNLKFAKKKKKYIIGFYYYIKRYFLNKSRSKYLILQVHF